MLPVDQMAKPVVELKEALDAFKQVSFDVKKKVKGGLKKEELEQLFAGNAAAVTQGIDGGEHIKEAFEKYPLQSVEVISYFSVDLVCHFIGCKDAEGKPKETTELVQAIEGLTKSIVEKLSGGVSPMEMYSIMAENLTSAIKGVSGAEKVPGEFVQDTKDFLYLVLGMAFNISHQIVGKALAAQSPSQGKFIAPE